MFARVLPSRVTCEAERVEIDDLWHKSAIIYCMNVDASNSEPKRVILPGAARGRASTGESDTYGIHNRNDQA
jgi:hypothetical protein